LQDESEETAKEQEAVEKESDSQEQVETQSQSNQKVQAPSHGPNWQEHSIFSNMSYAISCKKNASEDDKNKKKKIKK
jgi:hypothetical protein